MGVNAADVVVVGACAVPEISAITVSAVVVAVRGIHLVPLHQVLQVAGVFSLRLIHCGTNQILKFKIYEIFDRQEVSKV